MKIVTWNVNGLRAVLKKDFLDSYKNLKADVFCLQETKLQKEQIPVEFEKLKAYKYYSFAKKKGYSGTAILSKIEPLSISYGIGSPSYDDEGRAITLEFEDFYLVNAYVPNAQPELKRLDFRTDWEKKILKYLKKLDKKKPIVYCGDMNVAHEEIDLKNPKSNVGMPGFSDEERAMMSELIKKDFKDAYRTLYPKKIEYTWWSYRANARENNTGWRIDYFIVSDNFMKRVKEVKIHNEIYGSDHCPVELVIK
ncbi:MAG: exodeoxyribonuclease III [Lachnospiraceae bacterium]|nr:exodeoxyribonuclease III [Lachnospiraceae bacterium]